MKTANKYREENKFERGKNNVLCFCLFVTSMLFLPFQFYSQTKIGGVPGSANSNAYLQLGDDVGNKGFLMPRVSLVSTKQSTPLKAHVAGMQVYNDVSTNDVSPGVYYNDGTQWIRISTESKLSAMNVENGMTNDGKSIKLGGSLMQPTKISTTQSNTLAITGLQDGQITDNVVTIDPVTGVMKQINASSLNSGMVKQKIVASSGQKIFETPMPISSLDKIQVFRNGTEIEFTAIIGESQVVLQLLPDTNGGCFAGDDIKIYQWK